MSPRPTRQSPQNSEKARNEKDVSQGEDEVDRAVQHRTSRIKAPRIKAAKPRSTSSPRTRSNEWRYSESQSDCEDISTVSNPLDKTPQQYNESGDEHSAILQRRHHATPETVKNDHTALLHDVSAKLTTAERCKKSKQPISRKQNTKYHNDLPDESSHSVYTIIPIAVALLLIVFLFIMCYKCIFIETLQQSKPAGEKSYEDIEADLIRDLAKLRMETKQDKTFWLEVYSGLTSLTAEASPRQPAVFLVAVPEGGQRTAVCLAHNIADIVVKAFADPDPVLSHDTREHLQLAWDDHKIVLDDKLHLLETSHAAIVHNLEQMPANTATLLHGYCDNDNAPYKRRALLLLLELGSHYDTVSGQHLDLTVERRLHTLWKDDLEPDHIPGLLSRVTAQVMLVKPESKFVLDKLCPL